MSQSLCLRHGPLRCEVLPGKGGCISGLWWGDHAVLRSQAPSALLSVRQAASYPLIPYSNRIADGQLQWAGKSYQLPANFAPEPHAIHGVGWEHAWQVVASDAVSARLQYMHAGDAAWPFAFTGIQTFAVTGDTLSLGLEVTNQHGAPVPVGLGWHPYFVKDAQTRIHFSAQGRWEMDANHLPTQRLPSSGLHGNCQTLAVDHCFDGWDGALELRSAAMRIQLRSDLRNLVVFTTPARDSIAVEPVSHVNNALALAAAAGVPAQDYGVRVLQAGERFSCTMQIQIQMDAQP